MAGRDEARRYSNEAAQVDVPSFAARRARTTLVTVSHLIPRDGLRTGAGVRRRRPGGQATLVATADTFAAIALVTNAAGNLLSFGVVIPRWPSSPPARCRG